MNQRSNKGIIAICLVGIFLLVLSPGIYAFDQDWDSGHNTSNRPPNSPSGPPGGNNQGGGGDPVNLKFGNFEWRADDLMTPSLYIIRHYNSQDRYNGPLGYGWHLFPMMELIFTQKGNGAILAIVRRGDGIRLEFNQNSDGSFSASADGWNYTISRNAEFYDLKSDNGEAHRFDASGKLLSSTKSNAAILTFSYDQEGKWISLTDASGKKLDFSYGANNKISLITDSGSGMTLKYEYDSADNLKKVTRGANLLATYEYDSAHRLLSVTDARGIIIIQNTYDVQNRVVTQTYNGGTLYFTYNTDFTKVKNRRGNEFDVYCNTKGNPTRIVLPTGESFEFTYDMKMNIIQVKDADGITKYAYDTDGNITQVETPSGAVTRIAYRNNKQIASITDALDQITTFFYNASGNLIKMTDALNKDTLYEYDTMGKLVKMTLPDGKVTTFAHSDSGYLTRITDLVGSDTHVVNFKYDTAGNITEITRPDGTLVQMEYDDLNRLTQFTDNAVSPPKVIVYAYDAAGKMVTLTENGHAKTYEYTNGRFTGIKFPDDSATSYVYNQNDQITEALCGLGSFQYEYGNTDRLTRMTAPNAGEFLFEYTNDYVTNVTGPGGIELTFEYDGDRRVKKIVIGEKTILLSYDTLGNRTEMTKTDTVSDGKRTLPYTVTYAYDALNRLIGSSENSLKRNLIQPIEKMRTTIMNEILGAYNFNQNNRLITLVTERGSGPILANYSYEYPDTRFWIKTVQGNKRWTSQVKEDYFRKQLYLYMRTPFEIMR